MGSAGWGYTSILILERAVVCQQLDYSCVCLPKLKGTWALSEDPGIVMV